jgi:hypothetical protein
MKERLIENAAIAIYNQLPVSTAGKFTQYQIYQAAEEVADNKMSVAQAVKRLVN